MNRAVGPCLEGMEPEGKARGDGDLIENIGKLASYADHSGRFKTHTFQQGHSLLRDTWRSGFNLT